jgi:hypothetical protein
LRGILGTNLGTRRLTFDLERHTSPVRVEVRRPVTNAGLGVVFITLLGD